MIKTITALLMVVLFSSCGVQFHINKASKHMNKAISKGAKFSTHNDTISIVSTISDTIKIGDTVYITKTVTNTIEKSGKVRFVTRKDKRREYNFKKLAKRLDSKNERVKFKSENKSKKKPKRLPIFYKVLTIFVLLGITVWHIKRIKND